MNFQQQYLYWLAGAVLLIVAVMSFRDRANPRRITTGLFWGLYGLVFWSATGLTACWATCWARAATKNACCTSSLAWWWW